MLFFLDLCVFLHFIEICDAILRSTNVLEHVVTR